MKPNVTYKGNRKDGHVQVWVLDGRGGHLLTADRSLRIRNHSPTGFEWGYNGSGPAQLALAILLDFAGGEIAEKLYQDFKWDMVSTLPRDEWTITSQGILDWFESKAGYKEFLEAHKARPETVEQHNHFPGAKGGRWAKGEW